MFAECKVMISQNDSKTKSLQALNWCSECSLKGAQDLYIAHAKKPSQIERLDRTTIPTLIKENVSILETFLPQSIFRFIPISGEQLELRLVHQLHVAHSTAVRKCYET